jgi:hypothetical protein
MWLTSKLSLKYTPCEMNTSKCTAAYDVYEVVLSRQIGDTLLTRHAMFVQGDCVVLHFPSIAVAFS